MATKQSSTKAAAAKKPVAKKTVKKPVVSKKSKTKKVEPKKVEVAVEKTTIEAKPAIQAKKAKVSLSEKLPFFKGKDTYGKLRVFNLIMAALHGLQAIAMIVLAKDFRLPVTTDYLVFNEGTQQLESATRRLFDMPFVWLIIGFLIMCAVAHLVIATVYRKRYESDLRKGINKVRWIEYSFSASTMMIAIAMLSGVYDISILALMFVLTAGMNLMGLVMELWNQSTAKTNWLSYWIGCLLGIMPWVVYVHYLVASSLYGGAQPPTFVYFILGSIFVMFNTFAINMWLQYRRKGKWANYLYGEKVYIVLSLVAKSLLAWQVFAGTLRP